MRTEKEIKDQIKYLQSIIDEQYPDSEDDEFSLDDDEDEYYYSNSGWIEALEWVLEGKKKKEKT